MNELFSTLTVEAEVPPSGHRIVATPAQGNVLTLAAPHRLGAGTLRVRVRTGLDPRRFARPLKPGATNWLWAPCADIGHTSAPRFDHHLGQARPLRITKGDEPSLLLCGVGTDVDPPPGQPSRKPGVLPFPADRQRQLVVGHDYPGSLGELVGDDDLAHLCRR